MDQNTLSAYDKGAEAFAQDWHEQPAPSDLHAVVREYFIPGTTADIGCGSGREVAWLNGNGFAAVGFDGSEGLLSEARRRYPDYEFKRALLPGLAGIDAASFENVLCETVIMHLDAEAIGSAVRRLLDILKPGGILYLTWRVTQGEDQRDAHGRLYSAFESDDVLSLFSTDTLLLNEEVVSASSGKKIHRLVVRKP
ncbi:SAM-dependent methyltransferase [Rhodoligotrophos appendicifer]|uniref:class I SAM-dependent methyltransferase n=1 Tax=Rhodoligotrophos appendicifer TaxID=987056 RepID=UPI001185B276|nr:class I SAM-dependent methyltransferase [Rhodoligotrophos appendicifer]